ncbi:hypothetical protein HAX54_004607 [Datura stramonium]|uniref:Uncharacterized protein n=1 Tax=Datura stramonium TaxID=4076 RepID=A0ABS8T9L3_DATST|nr:hypothetical protein [Datura stramonium]
MNHSSGLFAPQPETNPRHGNIRFTRGKVGGGCMTFGVFVRAPIPNELISDLFPYGSIPNERISDLFPYGLWPYRSVHGAGGEFVIAVQVVYRLRGDYPYGWFGPAAGYRWLLQAEDGLC